MRYDGSYKWWALHYGERMLEYQDKYYKACDRNVHYIVFYTFLSLFLFALGLVMGAHL